MEENHENPPPCGGIEHFGGQRGIKNTSVLLVFPMVLQPAGERASIWTKVYEFHENTQLPWCFIDFHRSQQFYVRWSIFSAPAAKAWETQAKQRGFWCPVGLRYAKLHNNDVIPHESLPLSLELKKIVRIRPLAVEFSILGVSGASRIPLFCLCFLCFCSPRGEGHPFGLRFMNLLECRDFHAFSWNGWKSRHLTRNEQLCGKGTSRNRPRPYV